MVGLVRAFGLDRVEKMSQEAQRTCAPSAGARITGSLHMTVTDAFAALTRVTGRLGLGPR
ncbi:hypothetical protein ACLQ2N_34915 [Streptomyces sp. DT224]|uniref:hypothetical protein n=1 Tax=Streptomyces sp. DT224 TaxID=3393426 RepID=UPI003CF87D65